MIEVEIKPIPPGAIQCPKCGSPDTAKYKWPSDHVSQQFIAQTPAAKERARICIDCGEVWW